MTIFKVSSLADPRAADSELEIERPGWSVLRARPAYPGRGQVLWADLLEALGHDTSSALKDRAGSHLQSLAFAWMCAESTTDLIVAGAHMLRSEHLVDLCTIAVASRIDVWLIYDIETNDERELAEENLMMKSIDLSDFFATRSAAGLTEPVERPAEFPTVADVHFLGFLDIARESLSDDDYRIVAAAFHKGLAESRELIHTDPGLDEFKVAHLLHEITSSTSDLNEMTTLVKGAQLGAFAEGWHARVDVQRWAQRGTVAGLSQHLDDEQWSVITAVERPCSAAACVLAAIGFSAEEIPDVLTSEISDDGALVTSGMRSIPVPDSAQPLLRAQLIHRELVRAESGRFLVAHSKDPGVTKQWVGRLLLATTRDTGIVLRGRNASRRSIQGTGWTHRLGVSVLRLAA